MKRVVGAHQYLNQLVCNACGHKTVGLDQASRSAMRQHIKTKHPQTPAARPA